MPHTWNDIVVVTKEELVPHWYKWNALRKNLERYAAKSYGIKRARFGGFGHDLLIAFDSLPGNIKEALGDPRKVCHSLERYYRIMSDTITFYSTYQFEDGTYLDAEYQERYIINASVIKALLAIKSYREGEWKTKKRSLTGLSKTLWIDSISFQQTLKVKHKVEHTLPESEKRFKGALKDFEKRGYESLISGKHRNNNSRKVTETVLALLENMFGKDKTKPTATTVHRRYESFLNGYLEIINDSTGEVYDPKEYRPLSVITVTNYLANWSSKIGTYAARSGNRQTYMQQFKPYHSLDKPKFAGSIISIDDRQPPFKALNGKRIWFYMGIDLGSEAFTCWVYGDTKEGIIIEFYRQLVRNYAEWGLNLPAELEAEMSLNASFINTFLREGAMFQHVRIEANNARGKRIERYFGNLRYENEKDKLGWIPRPFATRESNQAGPDAVPAIPREQIVENSLKEIEKWNNMPHSVHTHLSRWEVFMQMQHPDLKPINYLAILPHVGYRTKTSCRVGTIRLNGNEYLLASNGKISLGEHLIGLMKQVEGHEVDVYWLDNNEGEIIKALVFLRDQLQLICEAIIKPTYNRAKIEQTDNDRLSREQMSSYVATIEAYGRKQKKAIESVTIIDNTPARPKSFIMPGLKHQKPLNEWPEAEILPDIPENEEIGSLPEKSFVNSMYQRF